MVRISLFGVFCPPPPSLGTYLNNTLVFIPEIQFQYCLHCMLGCYSRAKATYWSRLSERVMLKLPQWIAVVILISTNKMMWGKWAATEKKDIMNLWQSSLLTCKNKNVSQIYEGRLRGTFNCIEDLSRSSKRMHNTRTKWNTNYNHKTLTENTDYNRTRLCYNKKNSLPNILLNSTCRNCNLGTTRYELHQNWFPKFARERGLQNKVAIMHRGAELEPHRGDLPPSTNNNKTHNNNNNKTIVYEPQGLLGCTANDSLLVTMHIHSNSSSSS